MILEVVPIVLLLTLSVQGQAQSTCKDPVVEKRLLADDVRYASPFYVIALPRNPETQQMDNVCYTYYETGAEGFNHIMSVTNQDGNNKYYSFTKGDISDRMGLAEAKGVGGSPCTFHDYTLTPICNVTVFILYRCFIEGSCNNIDIGSTTGVDVRVVLAANPILSQECYKEIEKSLKDTSSLKGADYIFLPQRQKPQCITKINNTNSIGYKRAIGSKEAPVDSSNRFGEGNNNNMKTTQKYPQQSPMFPKPTQATWSSGNVAGKKPATNQGLPNKVPYQPTGSAFQTSVSGPGYSSNFAFSQASSSTNQGYNPGPAWEHNKEWNVGHNSWRQPGESHHHTWQSQQLMNGKPETMNSNNVIYHVHRWDSPPPGCCKCN